MRIGLLGGSFNPAHAAHREISLAALHRLGLDQVWWLVSPQNPLKPIKGMAPLRQRLAEARRIAAHPRIIVTALEQKLGTRYTVDTLSHLRRHYPSLRFVWLMGADNLSQMRHWQDWRHIAALMPIAVLDRPGYSLKASNSLVAQVLRPHRAAQHDATALASRPTPAFIYLKTKLNPLSATAIRAKRGSS
ncbi:nicotinate-nucleotide adenylyltransferase [Ferrovibrio sp. MS7]|uniref:nicotinate-nucleotide adenylyltransferase n=1 Tax=Ferrovibrio plantarum TaxID=3119164 RepID=UPI0031372A52